MNYIAEIRAFYDLSEQFTFSASCIVLWHALMYQANKTGWKAEFSVAISTLELRTGLKRGAIYTARNSLIQTGLISVKQRDGSQSALYKMHELCSLKRHNADAITTQTSDSINLCPLDEHNADATQTQRRHNADAITTQTSTINKQNINKTKRNTKDKNTNTPQGDPAVSVIAKPSNAQMAIIFDEIWRDYPNKKGKDDAFKHFVKALKAGVSVDAIAEGVRNYAFYVQQKGTEQNYIKHGSTWFNGKCWNDDYTVVLSQKEQSTGNLALDMLRNGVFDDD